MTRNSDLFDNQVLPRYAEWLNSFVEDGTKPFTAHNLVKKFEGSITKKYMRLVMFSVDSGDDGGPTLVTAFFRMNYSGQWGLVYILHEFDMAVDLVWKAN